MRNMIKGAFYFLKKNSGTICAIGALVSSAVTAYLSGKAAVKTYVELDPDTDFKLKAKVYAKNYIKPFVSYAITAGLIMSSDRLHVRTEMALASGVALWKGRYGAFNKAVQHNVDEDTYKDIRTSALRSEIPGSEGKELWFYETLTDQYIKTTYTKYLEAMLETNIRLQINGEVSYSVFVDYLGGITSETTDNYIWSFDCDMQNYTWSYHPFDGPISLYKEGEKELRDWIGSDKKMAKNDAIDLLFIVDPINIREYELDPGTGLLEYKETVPWE